MTGDVKVKFQVLVSTMNQKDKSLLSRMNLCSDAIVINQSNNNSVETIQWNDFCVKWINTTEHGLSKSRNMAIRNADADICLLADDDEILADGYVELIKNTFQTNPHASIISFKVNGIEQEFKNYPLETKRIGYLKSLKTSSVELAFRLKDIKENALVFDELIGAGTQFLMGEENTFLFRCLDKKLRIIYVPEIIANLHIGDSTWFTGYNTAEHFIGRGASFAAMSKKLSSLLIFQWALRKRALYKGTSVFKAIKMMKKGKKFYLDKKKEKEK